MNEVNHIQSSGCRILLILGTDKHAALTSAYGFHVR